MTAILQATNITKKFGAFAAVKGISMEVRKGECVAFLGPNGAGKTTTVEMLEGLQEPTSGEIQVFGQTFAAARREILERTGVILQETKLYKKYTVRETLALFASFFKTSLPVATIISQLQLEDKKDERLENLSGGQRQRVYLGCALINNPELLFLDEPTTGLDPQARRMLWDLLKNYKGRERGILLTTHYMDEAEQLADRVLVIDQGKIIAEGTPQELIRKVCGEQVLTFSFHHADQSELQQKLAGHLTWFKEAIATPNGFEMITAEPVLRIQEISRTTDALGLQIETLEMRRSTLEDVFLKLTGRNIRDD